MIINFKIESEDSYVPEQPCTTINFSDSNSFSYTFWNHDYKLPHWYAPQAIDLLYISMAVFAADRLCLRSNTTDGWSRNFILYIPVVDLARWQHAKKLLEETLGFLSGDSWNIQFREREESQNEKIHFEKWEKNKMSSKDYAQVCMMSGGLDSFIGSINLLESSRTPTIFVSHYGGGKGTKEFQDILKEKFIQKYGLESRDFRQFYAKVVGGIEDTTRTRSFMFFAHAIAVASAMQKQINLIIPENGFISLNIPSTFSRIGTSSTRTTHPHYMKLFQLLLDNLNLHVTLVNPYQFKTKGEMVSECKNQQFLAENLGNTMSCSHPDNGRMLGERTARHCGYCLPCVIRQAAIKKANLEDPSSYRDNKFCCGKTSKQCLNSYRLGLARFNPKYAFMTIQSSGPIVDNIENYTQLYIRGMEELKAYLEDIHE